MQTESTESGVISERGRAAIEATFVTVLWASSYVLIAVGLEEIPALTFAGLRYGIATIVLLPFFLRRGGHRRIGALDRRSLAWLVVLGVLLYALTQGAQFVALQSLRASTISLVLSLTPALVALLAVVALGESTSTRQWAWIGVLLIGVGIYFYPFDLRTGALVGLAVIAVGLLANALASVLGRSVNHDGDLSALSVTTVSMGIGSAILLATGLTVQGLPPLSLRSWAIVCWLAVVNTAFAFTLWNRTLRTLSATESSVINNTMLVQVACLGWLFLGEGLSSLDVVGLALVTVAAAAVQIVD